MKEKVKDARMSKLLGVQGGKGFAGFIQGPE
jgi:hypothetical protein